VSFERGVTGVERGDNEYDSACEMRKMWSAQGWQQRMAKVQNAEEILPQVSTPWVRRTNVTDDRQTTGAFAIAKTRT